MSYYYGRRWRKMLRPHWASGEVQAPSGDLLIHVAHLPQITADAPTIGQVQALTSADASLPSPDVRIAPILQQSGTNDSLTVTATVIDGTLADVTIGNVEIGSGNFHAVIVPSAESAPSGSQIVAGNDASNTAAEWAEVRSAIDNEDVTLHGYNLTEGVEYKAYVVHESIDETLGTVASSAAFTPGDVTAPILSSAEGIPGDTYDESDTATLRVTTETAEGTLYGVVTSSSTTPSVAQVKAGQDHTGATAVWSGSQAVTVAGRQTMSATGLSDATTYYAHFTQTDAQSNDATVLATNVSFTTPSATLIESRFTDGTTTGVSLSGLTATGAQSDPDGGSNAVLLSNTQDATIASWSFNVVWADGVNRITFRAKDVAKSTSKRWVRIRTLNVSDVLTTSFNITDGTGAVDLGGGWYEFSVDRNRFGDGDLDGLLICYISNVTGSSNLPASDAGLEQIAFYLVECEYVSDGLTPVDVALGALAVDAPTVGGA